MPETSEQPCLAPVERAGRDEVIRQHTLLSGHEIPVVLDAVPVIALVLNRHSQVIFGNRKFLEAVGATDIRDALGQRPGEAFHCVHAGSAASGCGTGEFCEQCGAVRSIMLGLAGWDNVQECSLNLSADSTESLDLRVSSTPLSFNDEQFILFSIIDVSHEMRRRSLERIFFHDMLNTVGGVQGLMEFLVDEVDASLRSEAELIQRAVTHLADEITYQKQLLAAETNELEPNMTMLRPCDVLDVVATTFQNGDQARGKRIEVHDNCRDVLLRTDPVLLRRVLGNMLKNALEATEAGGSVSLGCDLVDGMVRFAVRNDAVIPRGVQMRLFNRSFSTKGSGRGLGTYSMKLITERYLGGSVSFASTPGAGTVFYVRLPLGEFPSMV